MRSRRMSTVIYLLIGVSVFTIKSSVWTDEPRRPALIKIPGAIPHALKNTPSSVTVPPFTEQA